MAARPPSPARRAADRPQPTDRTLDVAALRVVEVDPLTDPRWEAFVAAHPDGLAYHHPLYLQAVARGYGRRVVSLACEDADRQIRGLVPLLYRRRPVRSRHLLAPSFCSLAPPLALDGQAMAALVQAAVARVQGWPGARLELKGRSLQLDGLVDGLAELPSAADYVLELPRQPDELRFGKSRNHTAIQRAVTKAARAGVRVRPAQTEEELRAWYGLYLVTMRDNGAFPRPYRFFELCWQLLRPRGLMRLLLAEQGAGTHARMLAGALFFMFGQTVFFFASGRRREDLPLRPNDAIHWQAIHDACREGFRFYDLTAAPQDDPGLARFKAKWGADLRWLHRYSYPARPEMEALEQGSPLRRVAREVVQRLPAQATAWLGSWVYRLTFY